MSVMNMHRFASHCLSQKSDITRNGTEAEKCNSMKALRAVAERNPPFRDAALDSIAPVKIVLTYIAKRLELKGKKFSVFTAASPEELDDAWTALLSIDQQFLHGRNDIFSTK